MYRSIPLPVSQRAAAPAKEERLSAEREHLLRCEIEALAEGVLVIDLKGRPLHTNTAARELLGIDESAREGGGEWWTAFSARHSDSGGPLDVGRSVIESGVGVRDVHVEIKARDESTRFLSLNYSPLQGEGAVEGLVLSFRDITTLVHEAERNAELVSEQELARQELRRARDHLQAITDSIGEGPFTMNAEGRLTYMNLAAQEILGWSAEEMQGRMASELTRAGSREGGAPASDQCPILEACRAGETVRSEAEVFMTRDGRDVPVAYTAAPLLTTDGTEGCVVVFQDISERKTREEALKREAQALVWIERIKDALAHDGFMLYAQPIIDLRTREVVQRELLLRMNDPKKGVIGAGEFLPIAEKYGLIEEIDRWVISHAMELAAGGAAIEVNISAASISRRRIIGHIERCLSESKADPGLIMFEITETALIGDEKAGREFVECLHTLGCGIALDDFGTGYGGFTYLKQLPVDCLKIDVEFVRDLPTSASSHHVVEAIIALARAFGVKTVAEGAEDAATLELLLELGVDLAQGYHIDGPRPFEPPRALPAAAPMPAAAEVITLPARGARAARRA